MININHKKPWGWDWGYFLLRLICPMSAESVLISWQKTYSLKKTLYRAFNENVKSKGILQFHKKKKKFKCGAVTIMNISYGYSLVLCIICILYFIPHGLMESDGLGSPLLPPLGHILFPLCLLIGLTLHFPS